MTKNDKYIDELLFLLEHRDGKLIGSKYWASYANQAISYLCKNGFENFRSGEFKVACSYGVVSPPFCEDISSDRFLNKLVRHGLLPHSLAKMIVSSGVNVEKVNYDFQSLFNSFSYLFYRYVEGIDTLKKLNFCVESKNIGNPSDMVIIPDGNKISASILFKYLHYLYMRKFIDQMPTKIVEIGSGAGFLACVLHKIHPETKIILIDLPETLATAYFYLDSCFPGEVMPYSEVMKYGRAVTDESFQHKNIILIPSYDLKRLELNFDIGIGTATFQEMDQDAVVNYINFLNDHILRDIYIYGGDGLKSHTVQKKYIGLMDIYSKNLTNFTLHDHSNNLFDLAPKSPCMWFNPAYTPTFWKRKI